MWRGSWEAVVGAVWCKHVNTPSSHVPVGFFNTLNILSILRYPWVAMFVLCLHSTLYPFTIRKTEQNCQGTKSKTITDQSCLHTNIELIDLWQAAPPSCSYQLAPALRQRANTLAGSARPSSHNIQTHWDMPNTQIDKYKYTNAQGVVAIRYKITQTCQIHNTQIQINKYKA